MEVKKRFNAFDQQWLGREPRFIQLLVWQLAVLVLSPLTYQHFVINIVVNTLFLGTLLIAITTISKSWKPVIAGTMLLIPIFGMIFVDISSPTIMLGVVSHIALILFCGLITFLISTKVFGTTKVNANMVVGALCIYLLVGMGWAFLYELIEMISPGSYNGVLAHSRGETPLADGTSHGFIYFSYVTMTTLGYGDITPAYPFVRSLAAVQAIVGQFFIATVIGRLVGLHLKHSDD